MRLCGVYYLQIMLQSELLEKEALLIKMGNKFRFAVSVCLPSTTALDYLGICFT